MSVFRLLIQGIKTTNSKGRIVLYLWITNFVFSLVIVAPFYFLLSKEFSRSLIGNKLGAGFDLLWLGDLFYKFNNIPPALIGWFLVPGILFLLLYMFLNGGIIGRIVAQRESVNFSNFFGDCGKYFLCFFRIFLISLIGYALVFGVIYRYISELFELWTDNASTEWPLIISSNIKFLILILLFSIIRMFFDYARVSVVVEDSRRAIRATILSLSFVGKRFFKAWFLYLLVGIISLIFFAVCLRISRILPSSGLLIIVVFLWHQIYILSRMWTKMLFFSSEYHFFYQEKISLY
ncbi:MAG: hypothetical protein ACETWK_07195 [Candidatus Aminicenantaceae bacterium]